MSTKVVTGKVRFSYCNVFQAKAMNEGQEPKYSLCILIPKSDEKTLARINAAIEAAKEQGKASWGGKIPANIKSPLRDGDTDVNGDGDLRPEAAGCYFINCSSKQKPGVVDKDLNEVLDTTEVYSGCYGRVSINFYPFSVNGNRGIACGLNNVQKLADGESLGGRSRAEDDFSSDFEDDGLLD